MPDLTDKVALVLGGSRGIGAAISTRLARHGADVALTYASAADAAGGVVDKIVGTGRRGEAIPVEAGDTDLVAAAVDHVADGFGRLDILVNNAAAFPLGPVEDLEVTEFDRTIAVNVRAPLVAVRAAVPHMESGGRIISIGSHIAEQTMFPRFTLYSLSKTALVGLTKGLARDLGPRGITANLVHPGPIDTDLNPADGPGADTIAGLSALGRYGTPDDIAATVVHLAGEEARYITGAAISVDGGINA